MTNTAKYRAMRYGITRVRLDDTPHGVQYVQAEQALQAHPWVVFQHITQQRQHLLRADITACQLLNLLTELVALLLTLIDLAADVLVRIGIEYL